MVAQTAADGPLIRSVARAMYPLWRTSRAGFVAQALRRKLTTILSADVAGYSRLMDEDEVATVETLRSYREAIEGFVERHVGRLVGTAGDGLIAEFDSVVEAVQCAAEVQREFLRPQ
jgi:class 3 adenylate cyclase